MKIPSFSIKEMSRVAIGPSLDMSLIAGAEAPTAFSTNELRTNLIDVIDRDQKYLQTLQDRLSTRTARYDDSISRAVDRRNRDLASLEKSKAYLNERIQGSLNWLDDRVNKSALRYDGRISYLEQRMVEASSAFENSRENIFSREVKRGASKNHGRVPYYILKHSY
jgi:DNA anti-recombination protein RmuC